MRAPRAVLLAGIVIGAVACNRSATTGPELGLGDVPAEERRELFDRLCASCHGVHGRGDGPVADELKVRPPDLGTLARQQGGTFPREQVLDVLSGQRPVRAHGTIEMPIWGQRLAPAESVAAVAAQLEQARLITALADYVESLQR